MNCLGFNEILEQFCRSKESFRDSFYSSCVPYPVSLCYGRKTELSDILSPFITIGLHVVCFLSLLNFPLGQEIPLFTICVHNNES